jgi:hypothetical protein
VRREVWARDGGCCACTSAAGRRCGSRVRLEYDHIVPIAKGGAGTADNLRLLCRAHNQHHAGRAFGAGFMAERRGRERAAPRRDARCDAVIPWLRQPGLTLAEARDGAEACRHLADAPLERRVAHALASRARARFWMGAAG